MKKIQAAYLRPSVTPQQGEAYLAEMPALEVRTSRYPKQALRAQRYQELLQSHCVPDCLRLFKEISCKERQRKNSGKKLNLSPAQPNQSPAACGGVYHTYKSIPTPAYRPAACVRGFLYPRRLHAMPGYAIIPLSTDYIPARGGTI